MLASNWVTAAIAMVASVIVARMMQPAELGVFTVTMAVSGLLSTLQLAGANEYLIYSKIVTTEDRRRVLGMVVILSLITSTAMVAGRPLWISVYGSSGVADVAAILAVQMLVTVLSAPVSAMLTREESFGRISIVDGITAISLSSSQILLVYWGYSYLGLAIASLLSTVISTILFCALGREHFTWRPQFKGLREIASFSSKLFGINALTTLYSQAPAIVIGAVAGLNTSALYGRANMIGQIYQQTISRAVDPIVRARLANEFRDGVPEETFLLASSQLLFVVSLMFFGFVAVVADILVPLIFGEQWAASASAMAILCFGFVVWPLNSPTASLLLANGQPGRLFRLRFINTGLRLVALFSLSPLGLDYVAAGMVATAYVNFALSVQVTHRFAGLAWNIYLKALTPTLAVGVLPVVIVFVLRYAFLDNLADEWLTLLGSGSAMACLALATLWLAKHPLWLELTQLFQWFNRAKR